MKRIKKLATAVANQIAAGEVVERPASVIKEVLENALDANAQSLVIDIEKGGLSLCRVRDDGDGIAKEDLALAIAPHATSKINQVNDLMQLSSLGFRGEALASISSVSKFSISSKPPTQDSAAQLIVDEQGSYSIQASAHPDGTTIEVRDLFYNVPVRRKFLKSAKTEFSHIEAVVKKIALSRFDIALQLNHNGKTILKVAPAYDQQAIDRRIEKLLGKSFFSNSHYFEEQNTNFCLRGWFASPEYLRSQNDLQYIFLNGRMIRDKLLMHAIRQVYEPYLYPGRVACFLLFFELPAEAVDVNVHPTKHEVRFQEPRSVHDFFVSILGRQLAELMQQEEDVVREILPQKKPVAPVESSNHYSGAVVSQNMPATRGLIIPVSARHGLYIEQQSSYLFEVDQLYKAWLRQRLEQILKEKQQLTSRVVLVPLTVSLTIKQVAAFPFEQCQHYGFDINQLSETTLCVRAFPVTTPHIDLKAFIDAVITSAGQTFLELIVNSHQVYLQLLSDEEQQALISFISSNGHNIASLKKFNEQQWQEVLNA